MCLATCAHTHTHASLCDALPSSPGISHPLFLQYPDICFGTAPPHTDREGLARVFPSFQLYFKGVSCPPCCAALPCPALCCAAMHLSTLARPCDATLT